LNDMKFDCQIKKLEWVVRACELGVPLSLAKASFDLRRQLLLSLMQDSEHLL